MEWITAFALTLGIEYVVVSLFLKDWHKAIVPVIIVNVVTHPLVWFVWPSLLPLPYWIIGAELFAFLAETVMYRYLLKIDWEKAVIFSLAANMASYLAGELIYAAGFA